MMTTPVVVVPAAAAAQPDRAVDSSSKRPHGGRAPASLLLHHNVSTCMQFQYRASLMTSLAARLPHITAALTAAVLAAAATVTYSVAYRTVVNGVYVSYCLKTANLSTPKLESTRQLQSRFSRQQIIDEVYSPQRQ